jgi:outer membrane protein TolC
VTTHRFPADTATGAWDRSTPLRGSAALAWAISALLLLTGCPWLDRAIPQHMVESDAYYLNQAAKIAYPPVELPTPQEAFALDPRRLRNERQDMVREVTLREALHSALANSDVVRSHGQFLAPGSMLLNHPDGVASSFDPAIQETGVLYGQRGVQAALSEFDAQLATSMLWGRNEQISNNAFISGGVARGGTLQEDTGNFDIGLQKRFASGGSLNLTHNWDYSYNNSARLFNSVYEGSVRAEYRQPLLAGAGKEYNLIAGPISQQLQGVTGVGQGVVIARINNDITVSELEMAIAGLLRDVESTYWHLQLACEAYDCEVRARDEAATAWRRVQTLVDAGDLGTADEAAAREVFLRLSGRADSARNNMYSVEAELRRLMGLSVNDGQVLRPADQPTQVEVVPDWETSLLDALSRRPELRRQKSSIKSLELQLRAARLLTRPRLDFVSSYRINGFGNDLFGPSRAVSDDGTLTTNLGNAYDILARHNQTGWNLGFQFSMPVGLRYAHAQVRNYEFRLQKAQAVLATQEIEISHELAAAFRDLDAAWMAMQTTLSRLDATKDRLTALQMEFQTEPTRVPVERILAAHEAVSQAEIEYASSVADYNIALADVQYRSGKMLEYNSVQINDGPPRPDPGIPVE